jgi:class 3 adenylate cyclase
MKFFLPENSGNLSPDELFRELRSYVQDATGWPIAGERIFSVDYFDNGTSKRLSVGSVVYGGEVKCILASDLVLMVCAVDGDTLKAPVLIDRRDVVHIDWFEDFAPIPLAVRRGHPNDLPEGEIAFLQLDLDGAFGEWDRHPAQKKYAMVLYETVMQNMIHANYGHILESNDQAYVAGFHLVPDALQAALEVQLAVRDLEWPDPVQVQVKIGIHCGDAKREGSRFEGLAFDTAAELKAMARGGQTLVSDPACDRCVQYLPPNASLKLIGLRPVGQSPVPMSVFQLIHPRLDAETSHGIRHQSDRLTRLDDTRMAA